MSNGEVGKVTPEQIQRVQNLIERCLTFYLSKKEVADILLEQANIEPLITELVWRQLEEENPEFFKDYYLRVAVQDQILQFNSLLDQHIAMMHQRTPPAMGSEPLANGSHHAPSSASYVPEHTGPIPKAMNMHQSLHLCFQNGSDMSAHPQRVHLPRNLLAQNSNFGMNPESAYRGNTFMFGSEGNFLDSHSATVSPESHRNPLNDVCLKVSPDHLMWQIQTWIIAAVNNIKVSKAFSRTVL